MRAARIRLIGRLMNKTNSELFDHIEALESCVRAADRMRSAKRRHWSSDFHETQESLDAAMNAEKAYDTQRAAVGEIGAG